MESVYAVHQDSHQFCLFSCYFYIVWVFWVSLSTRYLWWEAQFQAGSVGTSFLNPRTFSFICNGRQSKCIKVWTRRGYESAPLVANLFHFVREHINKLWEIQTPVNVSLGCYFVDLIDKFTLISIILNHSKKLTGAPFRSEMKIWHFLENHAGKKIFFCSRTI